MPREKGNESWPFFGLFVYLVILPYLLTLFLFHFSLFSNIQTMNHSSKDQEGVSMPQKKKMKVSKKNTSNSNIRRGRWDRQEHKLFVEGLAIYGRQWKVLADLVR